MLNLVHAPSSIRSTPNLSPTDIAYKTSAFEGAAGALMTVDRDLKLLHVNEAMRKLLQDNEAAFRSIWPNFNANAIVGSCIDMFHKNLSHRRQLLSNPDRLPYKTNISVGDLKFARRDQDDFRREPRRPVGVRRSGQLAARYPDVSVRDHQQLLVGRSRG